MSQKVLPLVFIRVPSQSSQNKNKMTFPITLEVLPMALPAADKWFFYLDLWQNPFSVAEYHQVGLWSEAHLP